MKGYLGEIKLVALREPPEGWVWCFGQYILTEKYSELNSIIGSSSLKPGCVGLPNLSNTQDMYKYMICIEGENPYGDKKSE